MMHYGKNYTGNARFYGFCVDLLERVSKEVGFDYILDLVPDRKYGAQDAETGEWNGMVLHLMKHVCDVGPEADSQVEPVVRVHTITSLYCESHILCFLDLYIVYPLYM